MSIPGLAQVVLYVVVIFAITKPVGLHLWRVFAGERTVFDPLLRPAERVIYRLTGVNADAEQGWVGYTFALLIFSAVGALVTYGIEPLWIEGQHVLQALDAVGDQRAHGTE